jgi:acetyl esterase/lipase
MMIAQKIGLIALSVIIVLVIVGFVMVNSWKKTPYGTLHPYAALLLKVIEFRQTDIFGENNTPAQIRETSANGRGLLQKKLTPIDEIRNSSFPGPAGPVPIRLYIPKQQPGLPVIIYYHGGGWVIGNLDSHDNICRTLAKHTSGIVVSVGYRLAPENPFPAAMDDAYAALLWVSQNAASFNGDPNRIIVAGDSAGGNLAAAVSLMARDQNGPRISAQVLIYPATNLSDMSTESYKQFTDGFFLTKRYMEKFRSMYLPRFEDWQNVHVSPLLAENLENLPPALILTAEFDPLRDEGEAYGTRLKDSGVPTKHIRYQGMIHGFVGMDRLFDESELAIRDIADHFQDILQ